MTRILILEDTKSTTDQLVKCLNESLPDLVIDTVSTATAAVDYVERSVERHQPYEIYILDAKVPGKEGDHPEVHPEVCVKIGGMTPNALIVHLTAFPQDPLVKQQLHEQLGKVMEGRPVLIDKLNLNYMKELRRVVTRFIFEKRIEARMANLFGSERNSVSGGVGSRSPSTQIAHVTQELAALARDISAYWSCLSEPMRARIRDEFFVDDQQQPVSVSLLDPESQVDVVPTPPAIDPPVKYQPEPTCQ